MSTTVNEILSRYSYIRLAHETDNQSILSFLATAPMKTKGLHLRYDRSPDYFSFLKQQGDDSFTFIFENEDRSIGGMGALSFRDHFVGGKQARVAYLSDLRLHEKLFRKTRVEWRRFYTELVATCRENVDFNNCRFMYSAILEKNTGAVASLASSKTAFVYREIGRYQSLSILAKMPSIFNRVVRIGCRTKVVGIARRARETDLSAIRAFLHAENCQKPLGDFITPNGGDELDRRLRTWDNFSVSSFIIVEDLQGNILGCVSPCSHTRSRRLVMENPSLRHRLTMALLPLVGGKRMREREGLSTLNLSHFEVSSALDPIARQETARCLLNEVFSTKALKSHHVISVLDFPGQSLAPMLRSIGCIIQTIPGILYQVHPREHSSDDQLVPIHPNNPPRFELGIA